MGDPLSLFKTSRSLRSQKVSYYGSRLHGPLRASRKMVQGSLVYSRGLGIRV